MIVLFAVASIISSCTFGLTTCHNAYSCKENTITESSTDNVQCYGYQSCFEATITVTGASEIYCFGSYSCYVATELRIDTTSGDYDIACFGLFSCAFIDTIYSYDGDVLCYAEKSCFQSNIEISTNSGGDHLIIGGDHGGALATLSGGYYNKARGNYAWKNATVYGTLDNCEFDLWGDNAGYGAIIICGNGLTCNVDCSGNSCNDISITCDGAWGCDDITNFISARAGGNIYFTGALATNNANGIIETTREYNIICSGYFSCYYGKTIRNARHLFCTGVVVVNVQA